MNSSLSANVVRLQETQRRLEQRWATTTTAWSDPVSRAFEHNHLHPLLKQVEITGRSLDQLAQLVSQARREIR